jgi:hypothetical protein
MRREVAYRIENVRCTTTAPNDLHRGPLDILAYGYQPPAARQERREKRRPAPGVDKRRTAMKRLAAAFTVLTLAFAAFVAPARAQAEVIVNDSEPLAITVFVECANGGAGELVALSGDLHVLIHETTDSGGGFHFDVHFQPQGVSGVGLSSGNRYQGTGVTSQRANERGPAPFEFSLINNFRIIGQGPGNNFVVHENLHITVNANGDITAFHDNFSTDCK